MRKLKLLVSLVGLIIPGFAKGQYLKYFGLEYYDQYLQNPAEILAEKNLQLDINGFTQWRKVTGHPKGYFINSIGTLKKIHSSVRLLFDHNTIGLRTDRNFNFGYAFRYSFSTDLSASVGIDCNIEKQWDDLTDIITADSAWPTLFENKIHDVDAGLCVKYRKLTLGLSERFRSLNSIDIKYSNGRDTTYSSSTGFMKLYCSARYDFSIADIVNVSPLVSLDYYKDYDHKLKTKFYLGILANYKDIIGIGVVHDRSVSVILNAKVFKRFRFYVLVNNAKWFRPDSPFNWSYTGQLRINI